MRTADHPRRIRPRRRGPRRPRGSVQQGIHLSEGGEPRARRRGPRSADRADDPHRGLVAEATWQEAFDTVAAGPARSSNGTGARRSRCTRATRTRTPSRGALHPAAAVARVGFAQLLFRQQRGPDAQARIGGADVRRPPGDPGTRPRPHRLPADARRQPARIQRITVHRADFPVDCARFGARRQGRGRRPPRAPAPPTAPTSTCSSAPAPTRSCCSAIVSDAVRRGPRRRAPPVPVRLDESARSELFSRPMRWPRALRRPGRDHRKDRPRTRRRGYRCGLRPDRHRAQPSSARSRSGWSM